MHAFLTIEFRAHMPFFFAVPQRKISVKIKLTSNTFCNKNVSRNWELVFVVLRTDRCKGNLHGLLFYCFFFYFFVLLLTIITSSLKNVLREQLCNTMELVYGHTCFVWFIK